MSRRLGDRALEARALGNLGVVAETEGRLDEARERYTTARAIYREIDSPDATGPG